MRPVKNKKGEILLRSRGSLQAAIELAVAEKRSLEGADLRGRDLRCFHLSHALLKGADFREANLRLADFTGADLSGADLRGAKLERCCLSEADLRGAKLDKRSIPTIENIDAKILTALRKRGNFLTQSAWHLCETTHCRAGWAIHLAGRKGAKLEEKLGPATTGALIYAVSRPDQEIPDFYNLDSKAVRRSIRDDARRGRKGRSNV